MPAGKSESGAPKDLGFWCTNEIFMKSERPLSKKKANSRRKALIQNLFRKLFDLLVTKLNLSLGNRRGTAGGVVDGLDDMPQLQVPPRKRSKHQSHLPYAST